MTFIETIRYLKTRSEVEALMARELPDVEFDQIDVYLKEKIDKQSEIRFFDAEAIPQKLEIEIAGIRYVNLFPLYMLQEMTEEYGKQKLSHDEIAEKLIDYWEKDA